MLLIFSPNAWYWSTWRALVECECVVPAAAQTNLHLATKLYTNLTPMNGLFSFNTARHVKLDGLDHLKSTGMTRMHF